MHKQTHNICAHTRLPKHGISLIHAHLSNECNNSWLVLISVD